MNIPAEYSLHVFMINIQGRNIGRKYSCKTFLLNIQPCPMYGHVMHFLCSCQHCMSTLIEYFYCAFFFCGQFTLN